MVISYSCPGVTFAESSRNPWIFGSHSRAMILICSKQLSASVPAYHTANAWKSITLLVNKLKKACVSSKLSAVHVVVEVEVAARACCLNRPQATRHECFFCEIFVPCWGTSKHGLIPHHRVRANKDFRRAPCIAHTESTECRCRVVFGNPCAITCSGDLNHQCNLHSRAPHEAYQMLIQCYILGLFDQLWQGTFILTKRRNQLLVRDKSLVNQKTPRPSIAFGIQD